MQDRGSRSTGAGRAMPLLLPISAVPQALIALAGLGAAPVLLRIVYGSLAIATVAAVPLLAGRPRTAVVTAGALELVATALVPLPPAALLPVAVVVAWAATRGARWWAAGTVAPFVLVPAGLLATGLDDRAGRWLGTSVLLVIACGAGEVRRARRGRLADERRRAAERQRLAVETERGRIARELHDVLAHSLSSISVQANVGLHLAPDRPAAATEALEAIRDASRGALDEVRGLLGVLRHGSEPPLEPQPDLDALSGLVAESRRSGARIDLDDRLRPRPRRAVQLALYRIAQESLTNARRHAPRAAVAIDLAADGGTAVVRVRDRTPGARPAVPAEGNGIVGMRERAEALGGTLELARHDDGLEVRARIPVDGWRADA